MRSFIPDNLVFLDETSAKTNLTRLYGRAPQGKRLVDKTPHNHWVTSTYVCALRRDKIIAPAAFTGAMNATRFKAYVEQCLLPSVHPGECVIMDNLSPHKNAKIRTLFSSAGVDVLYLPPYSPDFNPIEMSFSKLKSLLRKEKLRDSTKLQAFLRQSPKQFSAAECEHYFTHAGYTLHS
jgi:transposase